MSLVKTIANFLLIIFGILIALILVEISLRFISPEWLQHRMVELNIGKKGTMFASDKGWKVEKINDKFVKFTPKSKFWVDHYEYGHWANIDGLGGRFTGYLGDNNNNIVPFLGDSFTFGIGVKDEYTYVSLLSQKLNLKLINLGVPGSFLPIHLDIIEYRHNELNRPLLYVLNFFLGNDFADIANYHTKPNVNVNKSNLNHDFLRKLNNFVYHNHFLKKIWSIQFVKHHLLNYINQKRQEKLMVPIFNIMLTNNQDYRNIIEKALKLELDRLKNMSNKYDFDILFILIPDKHQLDNDLISTKAKYYGIEIKELDIHQPSQILIKHLENLNFPYINSYDCLRSKTGNLYYVQDNHLTEIGHKEFAECVYNELNDFLQAKQILN